MPVWRPGLRARAEPSADRVPAGQRVVKGWPVLHEGAVPEFDPETWRLRVFGAVARPLSLDWSAFSQLPVVTHTRDWHCVTTWSRLDCRWGGVSVEELLRRSAPTSDATHVLVHCFDGTGYTVNLSMDDFARPDNLLATHAGGEPLSAAHGGPVRLVVHHLYAWKSAKWVSGIELRNGDVRGYWEQRGYHNRGDPWREQRYSYQEEDDDGSG